jgi:hypothetical protein
MLRMMNTPEEEMAQHVQATATEQQHTASAGHGAHEGHDMAGMDNHAMGHDSGGDEPRGL